MSKGSKLIVIDQRETELTRYADIWLRPRPGTDVALLNGIANVILNEGLQDMEFIDNRTEGYKPKSNKIKLPDIPGRIKAHTAKNPPKNT